MSHDHSPALAAWMLLFLLVFSSLLTQNLSAAARPCGSSPSGVRVNKSELFLGLSRPDGSSVTDEEFQRFVDAEAAPRLPQGFTVVAADGRYRDLTGASMQERARVLIALYGLTDTRSANGIDEIRRAYKELFQQESVLRVDGESCARS